MNEEQVKVFENVMTSINEDQGRIFCLYAAGGTGKTFVTNTCLYTLRSEGQVAIATALSALAATL